MPTASATLAPRAAVLSSKIRRIFCEFRKCGFYAAMQKEGAHDKSCAKNLFANDKRVHKALSVPTRRGWFAAEHVMRTANRAKASKTDRMSIYRPLVALCFSVSSSGAALCGAPDPPKQVSGKAIIMSALPRGTSFFMLLSVHIPFNRIRSRRIGFLRIELRSSERA